MKFSTSMHSIWFEYHWYHSISSLSILHKCFHIETIGDSGFNCCFYFLNWFKMVSSSISMTNGTLIICTTFHSANINRHTFRFNKIFYLRTVIRTLTEFNWFTSQFHHYFHSNDILFSFLSFFSQICLLSRSYEF